MGCMGPVVECQPNCIWAPHCIICNPHVLASLIGVCFCSWSAGSAPGPQSASWSHDGMEVIEVDNESRTLVCYHMCCGDAACCYCEPMLCS